MAALYLWVMDNEQFFKKEIEVKETPKAYCVAKGEYFPVIYRRLINKKELPVIGAKYTFDNKDTQHRSFYCFTDTDDAAAVRNIIMNNLEKERAGFERRMKEVTENILEVQQAKVIEAPEEKSYQWWVDWG